MIRHIAINITFILTQRYVMDLSTSHYNISHCLNITVYVRALTRHHKSKLHSKSIVGQENLWIVANKYLPGKESYCHFQQ